MAETWRVPEAFTTRMADDPSQATWVAALPDLAADLAQRWGLRGDGTAWSGHVSTVWPVLSAAGGQGVLKIGWLDDYTRAEPIALRAWAGLPAVELLELDEPGGAMLLRRLDGDRSLEDHSGVDEACTVIAQILAQLTSVLVPKGIRPLEVEVQRLGDSITADRVKYPNLLPEPVVDQALATLRELIQELRTRDELVLLHGDCHFLNVLHTMPDETPGWVAIDPLPLAGIREWEVTPLLRNRWSDAVASGDPDAALRRRVDLVSEIAGMEPTLVRAVAQAVAVEGLLWLLPRSPQQMFVPPYRVMSTWPP